MCVAVKICYQFKDLTSSILKHIVIGPEKFKKFHVPKSRQMKSKLFLLIFFYNQWATKTTVEWILPGLKQNFWRVRILSNMIWCWWWSQNLLPKSKLCDLLYNLIRLDSWSLEVLGGLCVCYKFITPRQSNQTLYPVIVNFRIF